MKRIAGGLAAASVALASGMGVAGLVAAPPASAAACSPALDRTVDGVRTVAFLAGNGCEFSVPESSRVRVLVVGGGGAGATSDLNNVGGGGGGGVAYGTTTLGGTIAVTVGAGGAKTSGCQDSKDGEASSIVADGILIRAFGGGRGAGCGDSGDGFAGGSGGGAHPWNRAHAGGAATKGEVTGATGITLLGSAGGAGTYTVISGDGDAGGGGGGGATSAGGTATTSAGGAGGEGFPSAITGALVVYGSGGGGSGTSGGPGGTNGGNGSGPSVNATAGVDGTGSGGGGGCNSDSRRCAGADGGKRGGSGIVVLKYSLTGEDVDLDVDVVDNGGGVTSGVSLPPPTITLRAPADDRGTCWPSVSGRGGTWVQLTAEGCTSSSGRDGAVLLGWATNPDFPVMRALAGVTVDEEFQGVRMIFIPVDGYTFLSSDNTLYAIWDRRTE